MRTNQEAVQKILGNHFETGKDLSPFIEMAAVLVDWLETNDTESDLSTNALEIIERNLSAHFYEMSDPIAASKSTDGAGGSFQGQTAMVLSGTKYGQTAMLLDLTGQLSKRSKEAETGVKKVASLDWVGLRTHQQIPYRDKNF